MDTKEILNSLEKFEKQYKKEKTKLSFKDFDEYFYVEGYFLNRTFPYLEKNFCVNVLQITAETLKNVLQDLEYYVNLRPNSPLMESDLQVLEGKKEIVYKLYFKLHIQYKKHALLFLKNRDNSPDVFEYLNETFKLIKEYYDFMLKTVPKLIKNLEKKSKEIKKIDIKKDFESSVYN